MDTALVVAAIAGLFSIAAVLLTKYMDERSAGRSANLAVLAEIQRLLIVLGRHKAWWDGCVKSGGTDLPLIPFSTPVFDEQVKTIGKVNQKMVAKVVAFYGYVKFINAVQGERAKYAAIGKDAAFTKQYQEILARAVDDYSATFGDAFRRYGLAAMVT